MTISPRSTPSQKWLPVTLLLTVALTITAVGVVYLRGPVSPAVAPDVVLPEQASTAAADGVYRLQSGAVPAGSTNPPGEAELSEWEEQREDELVEQRRALEMVANTPGVTPDEYVGEGDDSSFVKEGEEDQEEE